MSQLTESKQFTLQSLKTHFARLPDARQPGTVLHRLDEVLMVALWSVLCDCDAFTDMEDFAQTQHP